MGDTVTVACKLPHGLELRLCKPEEFQVPVPGGGMRKEKRFVHFGPAVVIKGYVAPHGMSPEAPVVGGYALTYGVDSDFFAEWLKQNADHDAVRNNLIFAHVKNDMVTGEAKEKAEIRNGLEPIDPTKPELKVKGVAKADVR